MKKRFNQNTKLIFITIVILLICIVSINIGIDNATGNLIWRPSFNWFKKVTPTSVDKPVTTSPIRSIIVAPISPIKPPTLCKDLDSENEFEKSYVDYNNNKYEDYCVKKVGVRTGRSFLSRFRISYSYSKVSSCTGNDCYVNEYICSNDKMSYKRILCENGCSNGACIKKLQEYPYCEKVYGNEDKKNINIVFIPGDGYDNLDFFRKEVLSHIDLEGKHKGFFYYEPFKSLNLRFNIYIVTQKPSSYTTRYDYMDMMGKYCPEVDLPILLQDHFPHTGQYKYPSCGIHESYNTVEKKNSVCVHEALGHGFGYLTDEYFYPLHPRNEQQQKDLIKEYPNLDIAGCPKWCDGSYAIELKDYTNPCVKQTSKEDCENVNLNGPDCIWVGDEGILYDYFGEVHCLPQYDTINIGNNCIGNSGCYFGSNGYIGVWRTSNNYSNIMLSGYEEFSDANKEHFRNLINCCYPLDCNNFDYQKCDKFSKTSPKFQACNICQ